jgi:UDP-N-acetylmuramate--alanine ligase
MDFSCLEGCKFYFVGIKGAGMSALALFLYRKGALIAGTDVKDVFPTQEPLERYQIPFTESIDLDLLPTGIDCVIYSPAYTASNTPALAQAEERGIPCFTYPEALGEISKNQLSVAICGTHGKTTTTAMVGALLKSLGASGSLLVGSAMRDLDGLPFYVGGDDFLVAEVCEYKRHFLHFHPTILVVLNIEWEHIDYFKSGEDTAQAFLEMALRLPEGGTLIYSVDDAGALRLSKEIAERREDIKLIPYGISHKARRGFLISSLEKGEGFQTFQLKGLPLNFRLPLMGRELVLNAVAALAVVETLGFNSLSDQTKMLTALSEFKGVKRRQERLGSFKGALILDDYAHHPTEIEVMLRGIKEFYPNRRLVVDFMFHTFSRTKGFLEEFAQALSLCDVLILHPIYTSAREKKGQGEVLLLKFKDILRKKKGAPKIYYFPSKEETLGFLQDFLGKDDLFITLGAGDNFHISQTLVGMNRG